MLSTCKPPYKTEGIDFSWDQLILGVNTQNSYPEIVEDFWRIIVPVLNEVKNIDIKGPDEEAWFHLRRATGPNTDQSTLSCFQAKIEILRLKRGFITPQTQEKIRLLSTKHTDVICAGWWPLNFAGRHDNEFLSFLQSLSVLRGRDRIFYNAFLANISDEYDRCPHCQEAYRIMMTSNSPWSESLEPWFAYISSTNMDPNRTHEYAHWFGHILSGWS